MLIILALLLLLIIVVVVRCIVIVPQSNALGSALDQPRNIRHHKALSAV